jgi:hypothetical protein
MAQPPALNPARSSFTRHPTHSLDISPITIPFRLQTHTPGPQGSCLTETSTPSLDITFKFQPIKRHAASIRFLIAAEWV